MKEGIREYTKDYKVIKYAVNETTFAWSDMPRTAVESFSHLWNSTIKKKELEQYGWNANPYVWVYEFEKISKEEAYERAEYDHIINNNHNCGDLYSGDNCNSSCHEVVANSKERRRKWTMN